MELLNSPSHTGISPAAPKIGAQAQRINAVVDDDTGGGRSLLAIFVRQNNWKHVCERSVIVVNAAGHAYTLFFSVRFGVCFEFVGRGVLIGIKL